MCDMYFCEWREQGNFALKFKYVLKEIPNQYKQKYFNVDLYYRDFNNHSGVIVHIKGLNQVSVWEEIAYLDIA